MGELPVEMRHLCKNKMGCRGASLLFVVFCDFVLTLLALLSRDG